MSARLEILKTSLVKKEKQFYDKLQNHIDTVKQANGQPLNDKRNGRATLNKWEQQNDALRKINESIEKTKQAIEKEERKILNIECANDLIPAEILALVEKGNLVQWRKHPNTFFVPGVDKARIVWDNKRRLVAYRYVQLISDREQRVKFARTYNKLNAALNNIPKTN